MLLCFGVVVVLCYSSIRNPTQTAGQSHGPSGQFSASYTPGARGEGEMEVDANGDIWYFGDTIPNPDSSIWKYDVSANQWGWYGFVSTDPIPVAPPTKNTPTATATPGRRYRPCLAIAGGAVFTYSKKDISISIYIEFPFPSPSLLHIINLAS
jgi:hypothetical protein